MIFSVLFAIVPILIIIAIVMAVRGRGSSGSGEEGASVTRHVWLYLLTLISLGIFAFGVGQLLSLLFDITIKSGYMTEIGSRAFNQEQLSMGLAMTIIGGPLWFLFWRAAQRRAKSGPAESSAIVRKFSLNLILLSAALTWLPAVAEFIKWLLAGVPAANFDGTFLSTVIVAGVIWFYHFRVSEGEGHLTPGAQTLRRWYVYILSGYGLVWLSVSVIQLINSAVTSLPIWGEVLVDSSFWNDPTRTAITGILFGGLAWFFHWFRMAKGDVESTLRQVYFYLLPVSGGAIAALVAATVMLYQILIWVFGATGASAGSHFQFLGWTLPTILVGFAVWGYHRTLAQEEAGKAEERRESARRVYVYLMNFIGLGTAVAGLVMLIGILLELVINAVSTSITPSAGWWREQLALCLALLITGIPLWFYYWNTALKRVQKAELSEWSALSRRIYLYTVVGIAIIAMTAGLVNLVYQLISGILDGFGVQVLTNSKWSLQALVVAAPLLWYHWQVLREDQKESAEAKPHRRSVTLLAADPDREMASRLEARLGYKIKLLKQAAPATETAAAVPDEEIERLAGEILASPTEKVMLVASEGRIDVLPYEED
ncbi:MAG: hypothetical protein JW954_00875 [Dehalococcoidaceae bacterium]|nr:hypothetical protein [Dehalococcoidaceae bacterium]